MDLAELNNTLMNDLPTTNFKLETKDPLTQLKWLQRYTENIRFYANDDYFWHQFWFLKNHTPEALFARLQGETLADGELPPHQALLLAFLQQLKTPGIMLDTFSARHRQLYYQELLGITQKDAQPDHVALGVVLSTGIAEYLLPTGTLVDGGQDSSGNSLQYALDTDLLVNPGQLTDVRYSYLDHKTYKIFILQDDKANISWPSSGARLFVAPEGNGQEKAPEQKLALYLGFDDIQPGQTLSLFWQFIASTPLTLKWFYLNEINNWVKLDSVRDNTDGFFISGLWQAILPDDAVKMYFPETTSVKRYWIKAEVESLTESGDLWQPLLEGILYNAQTATLVDADNTDEKHFHDGLMPFSVQHLVNTVSEVKKIEQPWSSWGGTPQEDTTDFFHRAATRLQHRQRALTWDNQIAMLKAEFPRIYDVISPNITWMNQLQTSNTQTLIVIPDVNYSDNKDRLRPQFSPASLRQMSDWLQIHTSAWANPQVENPIYIDVSVTYEVQFSAGVNPDYALRQLQQWLSSIYMPWYHADKKGVAAGDQIDFYQLFADIQRVPYVEHVKTLTLTTKDTSLTNGGVIKAQQNEVLVLVWQQGEQIRQGESK
ncbi:MULTISPECIES: baseplate J/gp47 family protein [Photorhabdus]|uniref:Baseplate protein J-like domain-containing protein n=2 Tax=Photorhabdus asymbiotica TaxID=291112 RepID=B6VL15_PHOAA|nr:hypothetical protein [Photorhabdus asymbiotica]RKS65783.1 hypothetical protein BDD30_0052 [Photorhabdus asymbiotica]CAQ84330.1 conserved hypothetical protein [Photorhabdus asymbiotica]CAR66845.1 Conserved Hypothetical Protein [Photorhabdus asymbiotica subsp. asymbiotica ATCC 43949]